MGWTCVKDGWGKDEALLGKQKRKRRKEDQR